MDKTPKKVDKIPEGYKFSHKDEQGRDVYKKSSVNLGNRSVISTLRPENNSSTQVGSKSMLRPPSNRSNPPVNNEDYLYVENTPATNIVKTPVVPPSIPTQPIYEDQRIDRKLQTPIHPNIDFYKYPNANGGFSQATDKYFDKTTQRQIDVAKSFDSNSNYAPSYIDNAPTVNQGVNQGTIKQGNPRITNDPNITNILNTNPNDKSGGMKGTSGIGTIGFKKGGLVGKIKGYAAGGDVDPYLSGNPNTNNGSFNATGNSNFYNAYSDPNFGVVGQNDAYSSNRQQTQSEIAAKKAKNNANAQAVVGAAGKALGGVGSSYYNSQIPIDNGDATRNAGMAAVSQTGAIGGAIGGISALGDKIGKPIKNSSEQLNSDGTLKDSGNARQNAIIGGLFSPSKALAARSQYKGGYTDISGKGYTANIEAQAQKQLNAVKAANLTSAQNQAVVARDSGNFNATINTPYNLAGAKFDNNKQLVLADGSSFDPNRPTYRKGGVVGKIKQMCAEGGVIKGKGTGKSDSINATIKANSFVVPVENASIAEEIRKKILKTPPTKKANLNQSKGEQIKVSNGEHLFTPNEKNQIEMNGIDLDDLAPDSELEENNKKNGGLTQEKAKIILHDETIRGKKITDQQRKFFGAISNGEEIKGYENGGKIPNSGKPNTKKTYSQLITPPMSWTGSKEQWKAATDKAIKEGRVVPTPETNNSIKAPIYKQSNSNSSAPYSSAQQKIEDNIIVPNGNKSPNQIESELQAEKDAATNAKALGDSTYAVDTRNNPYAPKSKQPRTLADRLSNVDPTAFVGLGQSALGLNMLKGQKRPVDNFKLDPTYDASVNRSVNDARFGLTPEQQFAANQDIQNGLNDAKYAGLATAGGNGVQAFNTNRAAINDAWKAKLGLKQADTDLRMQKQQYADSMVANRAGILAGNRRQAFTDAMNTFQQKQQAGSELIGAGLANTIGAYRFNQDMKARQVADEARGYSLNNYYGPTT